MDENGQKMSKSLGNVIKPKDIIDNYGVDGLRLWTAAHNDNNLISLSEATLEDTKVILEKLRNVFKYLLGNLGSSEPDRVDYENLRPLDKLWLHNLSEHASNIEFNYDELNFGWGH